MQIGIIGVGMVGGALERWFRKNTIHDLRLNDPAKNLNDDFTGCEAIFICIPVPASATGQHQTELEATVAFAKRFTSNVFIKSTVLPGTNDRLGTISCPEFLTARYADTDMENLPILVGPKKDDALVTEFVEAIFKGKRVLCAKNIECEMAKYAHNVFGAMKVTYWNIIYELCKLHGADYSAVLGASMLTRFIEPQHTHVPGPDGKRGYGGACFPENVASFKRFAQMEVPFFENIEKLNDIFRNEPA
jgi:UDP-glucose 6-dehydrogenase